MDDLVRWDDLPAAAALRDPGTETEYGRYKEVSGAYGPQDNVVSVELVVFDRGLAACRVG